MQQLKKKQTRFSVFVVFIFFFRVVSKKSKMTEKQINYGSDTAGSKDFI